MLKAGRLGAGAALRGSRREAAPAAPSGVATARDARRDSAAAGVGGTAGGADFPGFSLGCLVESG